MKLLFSLSILILLITILAARAKHHHHHKPLDVSHLLRSGFSAAECREAARVVDLPTLPDGINAGFSGYFTVDASTGARGDGGKMFWWYL